MISFLVIMPSFIYTNQTIHYRGIHYNKHETKETYKLFDKSLIRIRGLALILASINYHVIKTDCLHCPISLCEAPT